MKADIPVHALKEMLSYDPASGVLTWRSRPRSHFKSEKSWKISVRKYAGKPAGSLQVKGYRAIEITYGGEVFTVRAHRAAWALMTGAWPVDEIDHADLDKDNNRWSNLREASHMENCYNRNVRSDNKIGIKGVHLSNSGKFKAGISSNGTFSHLGTFDTSHEAEAAYRTAAKERHGRFVR